MFVPPMRASEPIGIRKATLSLTLLEDRPANDQDIILPHFTISVLSADVYSANSQLYFDFSQWVTPGTRAHQFTSHYAVVDQSGPELSIYYTSNTYYQYVTCTDCETVERWIRFRIFDIPEAESITPIADPYLVTVYLGPPGRTRAAPKVVHTQSADDSTKKPKPGPLPKDLPPGVKKAELHP
jgi:hypothetical protein